MYDKNNVNLLTFTMMVGIPGSGKSTAVQFIKGKDRDVVSSDAIRGDLFGSEDIQGNPQIVFDEAKKRICNSLNEGRDVIFDATNLVAKKRIAFLKDIQSKVNRPFNKEAIVMCTPIDLCIYRDAHRDRTVGEDVIYRMVKTFQYPQVFEGFDRIERYDFSVSDNKNLFETMYDMAKDFDQNTPHHKYRLYDHCFKVAAQFNADDIRHFAGIVHDIGKLITQTTDENGVSHYYSHENVSAYMVNSMFSLPKCGCGGIGDLMFFVNYHMHIRDIIKSPKAIDRYKNLWGEKRFYELVEFMEADNKASGREA